MGHPRRHERQQLFIATGASTRASRGGSSTGRDAVALPAVAGEPRSWRPAGTHLSAPQGSRLSLRIELAPDHEVIWRGASERCFTATSSLAVVGLRNVGPHRVEAQIYDRGGRLVQAPSLTIDVR